MFPPLLFSVKFTVLYLVEDCGIMKLHFVNFWTCL